MKLRAGIFFGGPSREREISFAGGRMVYDCLDQSMFEPVPVFVDSHKNLILLNWQLMYKESIGEFYPPAELPPYSPNEFRVYIESLGELSQEDMNALVARVGRRVRLDELPGLIDFAFLTMHGEYGADGRLQRQLDDLGIPYSGSGIQASEIGSDKPCKKTCCQPRVSICPNHSPSCANNGWPMMRPIPFSGRPPTHSAFHWCCAPPIRVRPSAYRSWMLPAMKRASAMPSTALFSRDRAGICLALEQQI